MLRLIEKRVFFASCLLVIFLTNLTFAADQNNPVDDPSILDWTILQGADDLEQYEYCVSFVKDNEYTKDKNILKDLDWCFALNARIYIDRLVGKGDLGVGEKDLGKARKWALKGAEKGGAMSMLLLSSMYWTTDSAIKEEEFRIPDEEIDPVKSYMWFKLALFNGLILEDSHWDFGEIITKIKQELNSEELAKVNDLAKECISNNYKDC